jgi:general secretion pathway protein A
LSRRGGLKWRGPAKRDGRGFEERDGATLDGTMYKKFFGLRANPFSVSPDPRYLFLTRHTQEALDCLTYGIQSRKGFILLTGEVGTGKTTLINKLLEMLRVQQVATAFIFNSRLDVPTFLNYMMADFGIPCEAKSKSKVLIEFYNWLLDRYRAGETAVLIVDEGQNLSEELLEEIRMMTNVETLTEKLLQIVLVGQPELEQRIKQPQLRQLRQRITLRARTYPLTLGETKLYVNQRLRIAGSNGQQIFSPESLSAIYLYSNGIPRVVNLICEQCLVSAFVDQQKVVKQSVVEAVVRDFDLDDKNSLPATASPSSAAPAGKIIDTPAPGGNSELMDAMKTLNDLADRLRASQPDAPTKRKS